MTESNIHNERKVKNLLLLGLLLLFVVFIFAVTIVKLNVSPDSVQGNPSVTEQPNGENPLSDIEPTKE